jgi:hypothetical protein
LTPAPRLAVALGLAVVVLVSAGCQTKPPARDYTEFRSGRDPLSVASQISRNIRACWLDGRRAAFADLTSAAELTSYANRPRVLIVPRRDPHGLPKLVIEVSAADRGASIKLFGPLMASAEAAAIRVDVSRWAAGGSGC